MQSRQLCISVGRTRFQSNYAQDMNLHDVLQPVKSILERLDNLGIVFSTNYHTFKCLQRRTRQIRFQMEELRDLTNFFTSIDTQLKLVPKQFELQYVAIELRQGQSFQLPRL
ncbi:hypothetical protein T4D_12129 [Trichinella pseudospiralis]|uniref:Uncharacterized protein n=1 Tax=Trichinella pseudospiralis TaxID=6337 RepID=A0A0V1FDW8_TRIPS|nr:hypothetical protein T4D_12129 [Trichinella pseudospiralis]